MIRKLRISLNIPVVIMILCTISCVKFKRNIGSSLNSEQSLSFMRSPVHIPVIDSGRAGLPSNPGDPFVLKDEKGYHLFVSVIFCKLSQRGSEKYNRLLGEYYYSYDPTDGGLCDNLIFTLAYAFSSDKGLNWTFRTNPILIPGEGDAWDSGNNETANVVRRDDTLYLFYSAYKLGEHHRYQIGVATLGLENKSIYERLMVERGVFQRGSRTEPLVPKRPRVFENNTQEPSVIFKDGRFEVFYIGLKLKNDELDPKLGGGYDGIALFRALFNENLELISRPDEPFLADRPINIHELMYFNNTYHLFYTTPTVDGGEIHEGENIAYSISNDDGRTWSSSNTILKTQPGDFFDNWGIMAPTIILDEGLFYLFYTAWGMKNFSCNNNPDGPRQGHNIKNNSACVFATMGRAVQVK